MKNILLRILESPEDCSQVEELQFQVWPGSVLDVVPAHMLLAAIHNGGLVIGAFAVQQNKIEESSENEEPEYIDTGSGQLPEATLAGFVFGFPGIYQTPDGPRIKHHSHMMGVLPAYRDQGIGFLLKRAQWQMVRHQNVDRITWTYDPLLSRNAHLNIARLGAVCNTYLQDYYGEMRDGMNMGVSSDRFQVDWWINSRRVTQRVSTKPRLKLDLAHFLAAQTSILNPTELNHQGLPQPTEDHQTPILLDRIDPYEDSILLVEIPANYLSLKETNLELARTWRIHTQVIFSRLFEMGYLITDFVHLRGDSPRSFYVLSHGESTL